jgi:hypothetical protein
MDAPGVACERQEKKKSIKRWRTQRLFAKGAKEIQLSAPSASSSFATSGVSLFRTGNGFSLWGSRALTGRAHLQTAIHAPGML